MAESAEKYYLSVVPEFDEGRLFMGSHEDGAKKECVCGDILSDHRQLRDGSCMFCGCPEFVEMWPEVIY